jgi:DNA-binding transcriptional LysR family regulator
LFRALHQHGTVTAAAQAVGISQPAASSVLRQMEDRLGFTLFLRERKRLELSESGRALLPEVLNALAGFDSVEKLSADLREGVLTRVVVGSVSTVAISLLPEAIEWVQARSPGLRTVLRTGTTLEIVAMAGDQRIDFGVVVGSAENSRVLTRKLASLSLCCVMRADHPLAQKTCLDLKDIVSEKLILLSQHLHVGVVLSRLMREAGLDFAATIEVSQSPVACALVEAGAGIAVLENLSAVYAERGGLVAKPLAEADSLSLNLVWAAGKDLSAPARALIDRVEMGAMASALPRGTGVDEADL